MTPRAGGRGEALREANTVILPLLAAARRIARLLGAPKAARLATTWDKRIHILVIDVPASRPIVVALYSSTQSSRPVSPSQARRRIERLRRAVSKLRGKLFNTADIYYLYISKVRFTRAAYREAKRGGVYVALTPLKARARLYRIFSERLRKLRASVPNAWGKLRLLIDALAILSSATAPDSEATERTLLDQLAPPWRSRGQA